MNDLTMYLERGLAEQVSETTGFHAIYDCDAEPETCPHEGEAPTNTQEES